MDEEGEEDSEKDRCPQWDSSWSYFDDRCEQETIKDENIEEEENEDNSTDNNEQEEENSASWTTSWWTWDFGSALWLWEWRKCCRSRIYPARRTSQNMNTCRKTQRKMSRCYHKSKRQHIYVWPN